MWKKIVQLLNLGIAPRDLTRKSERKLNVARSAEKFAAQSDSIYAIYSSNHKGKTKFTLMIIRHLSNSR